MKKPTQADLCYLAHRHHAEMLQDFLWIQQQSGNPLTLQGAQEMVKCNPRWQWMLDFLEKREGESRV